MGQFVVIAALVAAVALAVRSLWREHKSGRSACGGDCSHCKGCH